MEGLGSKEAHLLTQALLFLMHLGISVSIWILMMVGITFLLHPKFVPLAITLTLSFSLPMVVGFVASRIRPSEAATLTWFAGLIWIMLWGTYILDLPTGPSACYHCGATAKLWLTFLSFSQDSGLLEGQGRLVGTWPAAAMIGYALGAKFAVRGSGIPFES
jgi:hypothetical protein